MKVIVEVKDKKDKTELLNLLIERGFEYEVVVDNIEVAKAILTELKDVEGIKRCDCGNMIYDENIEVCRECK